MFSWAGRDGGVCVWMRHVPGEPLPTKSHNYSNNSRSCLLTASRGSGPLQTPSAFPHTPTRVITCWFGAISHASDPRRILMELADCKIQLEEKMSPRSQTALQKKTRCGGGGGYGKDGRPALPDVKAYFRV